MPHDSNSNAPASGPTSTSGQPAPGRSGSKPADKAGDKPAGPVSESQFLTRQAADAKAAIARVKDEIVHDVAQGVDPRAWMQVAPWTTLAGAAVAGFLAAATLVPSKEEQALRRLRKLEKALGEEYDRDDHQHNGHHDGRRDGRKSEKSEAAKGSAVGSIIGALAGAVQPILMNLVSQAVTGKAINPTPGGDGTQAPAPGTGAGSTPPGTDASQI